MNMRHCLALVCALIPVACSENAAPSAAATTAGTSTVATTDAKVAADADVSSPADAATPATCKTSADCGTPAACQAFVCDTKLGCVTTALPDGALCAPTDKCAVGGVCASGG